FVVHTFRSVHSMLSPCMHLYARYPRCIATYRGLTSLNPYFYIIKKPTNPMNTWNNRLLINYILMDILILLLQYFCLTFPKYRIQRQQKIYAESLSQN